MNATTDNATGRDQKEYEDESMRGKLSMDKLICFPYLHSRRPDAHES